MPRQAPGELCPRRSLEDLGEARGAQVGAECIFEELDHLARPCGAAVVRAGTDEGLFGQSGEIERHAELAAELGCEAEVLAGEVQGEPDVVSAALMSSSWSKRSRPNAMLCCSRPPKLRSPTGFTHRRSRSVTHR